MPKALRVLIVEDSEPDTLLLVRELQRGGFDVTFERVETEPALTAALDREPWQLVIADYTLPHFSAPLALKLVKQRHLDVPFIIVSGSIGEETAVEMMRAGAHDFLIKGKFARLIPAIERELDDAALRAERLKTQQLLANIIESSFDAIYSHALDGTILSWNPGATRIFGYSSEEIVGQNASLLSLPGQADELAAVLERVEPNAAIGHRDVLRRHKNGSSIEVSVTTSPMRDARGVTTGASVIARDISAAKEAERRLVASLHEKELLLKEIHHRVKNNLQIVASLLNLQSRRVTDAASLEAIQESQSRVQAIALFHEKLYRSRDLRGVDGVDYMRDLVAAVFRTSSTGGTTTFVVEGDALQLGVDLAIPCGLIVNELVTNSIKHAFPGGRPGQVRVELRRTQDGKVRIVTTDDGVGLPGDVDTRKKRSLGLELVATLSDQIGGQLSITSSAAGTRFELEFPLAAKGPMSWRA